MALKPVEHKAEKGKTFTLDEVDAFVKDARGSGATGTEEVKVNISWGNGIQKMTVEVKTVATEPTP